MRFSRRPVRAYADTTVFGGIVDAEFEEASRAFFEEVRNGRFTLVVAYPLDDEIALAPIEVQTLYAEIKVYAETVEVSDEIEALQAAYLNAGILAAKSATDALHIAIASVTACELIVSWNFRHIVRESKIKRFNEVNVKNGYNSVAIKSPPEVLHEEEKSV